MPISFGFNSNTFSNSSLLCTSIKGSIPRSSAFFFILFSKVILLFSSKSISTDAIKRIKSAPALYDTSTSSSDNKKSFLNTGVSGNLFFILIKSCRFPKKKSSSDNTEIASAPALIYFSAHSSGLLMSFILPSEGEPLFISQINAPLLKSGNVTGTVLFSGILMPKFIPFSAIVSNLFSTISFKIFSINNPSFHQSDV